MKIATRLLLALSGTVFVGASSMLTIVGNGAAKLFEGQLTARLEVNASHMLEKLDLYFSERGRDIRSFTMDQSFIAGTASGEQTTRHLREFLRWHPEYLSAAFLTMDRVRVADAAGTGIGEREDADDCWADLTAGRSFAVCARRASPEASPMLHLASVVRDGRGARGVVVLQLPTGVFEELLDEPPAVHNLAAVLHIDLVDRKGYFLHSNHKRGGILREISPDWAFIREKIDAGQASGSLRYTNPAEDTGEEVLVYVREPGQRDYPGSGWALLLSVPTEVVFAPVHELRLKLAAVVLMTGSSLLTVMFLLVRSFTRPIEELARAAREIGRGNLEVRVPGGRRDELGVFADTFNRMATDVQEAQRELAMFSRELEGLVDQRTTELLHTNELLHAELSERVKAQEELVTKERLLRLSADVGEVLTLEQTLEATLQRCADLTVRALDAAFARIWLLGDGEGALELKASAGMYTRLDGEHGRKILGKGKIGSIAQEQRPMLTNAVLGDPVNADPEWARREGMVAFAGHPLVVGEKTVGVLALFSRRPLEPFVLPALESVAQKLAAFIGRKRAEQALRVSEKRYRELFDSSTDGIYRTDARGVFTIMNRAGARLFGYENPEEILGRPALDFWRDPADRERFRRALEREKSVSSWRVPARKKSGEFLELETSSRILKGDDGAFLGIEGVLRDVTQRARSEAERDLMLAQLQEAAANIKTLSGLLPICAGCKKIRDDQGTWSQIETYISQHTEAEFSHGLCPECQKVYFPGVTKSGPSGAG